MNPIKSWLVETYAAALAEELRRRSLKFPGQVWQLSVCVFFFQAEDGIRDLTVTGVQTCALPISRSAPVSAGGLDQVDGAFGAEEAAGALDDQREQPIEVQLGGQLALDRGQRFDVGTSRRLQREEPRVLQRERRLVGEGFGQPDVRLVEGSPGPIADAEGADDPVVHDE